MKKKNILVFGAAGFIGTYLIEELLSDNYAVIASDISSIGEKYYRKINVSYIPVDITDQSAFKKLPNKSFYAVIHLAALQPANFNRKKFMPKDYIDTNVNGTLNILEFCMKNKIGKIIYASSHRNTSGLWKNKRVVKEADGRAIQYGGEYAMFSISESAAQDCVEYYRANYGLQGIIFRLPPVYGFGPHLEIFKNGKPVKTGFQTFIENAMSAKPLEVWGDSNVGRDIIYVRDVVAALIKAIESKTAGGLYNIASGYYLTLKEEVETIARVFWSAKSKPVIINMPEKPHRMDSFLYDNAKARIELGWYPQYDFEDMLHDYKKEAANNKFGFLLEKRKRMFRES
ncbi:MAG: NAD(P)-dependent oxidoreductase [Bacteroidetes bacterium]|nr:NAD(P)-dependent oxidoreductase [Bacteroidota bacterium]